MTLRDIKIGTRLKAAFGLMVLLSLVVGWLGIIQTRHIASLTDDLYAHPYTVTNAMRDIRGSIRSVEITLADLDPGISSAQLELADHEIKLAISSINKHFAEVRKRYLGNKSDISDAEASFNEWCLLLDKVLAAHRDKRGDAIQRASVADARKNTTILLRKTQVMIDFAMNKANDFLADANEQAQHAVLIMAAMLLIVCLAGLVIAKSITASITVPLRIVVQRIQNISQGELGQEIMHEGKDEVGDLAKAFSAMRQSLKSKVVVAEAIASGDYGQEVEITSALDVLGKSLAKMTSALRSAAIAHAASDWAKTGRNNLSALLAGEHDLRTLSGDVIRFLAAYLEAPLGTLYVMSEQNVLTLTGSYAFTKRKGLSDRFGLGEGLVGQAALERDFISLTSIPEDYLRINSSLGDAQPKNIVVFPILYEGAVKGVIELAGFREFSDLHIEFLRDAAEALGVAFQTVENQAKLRALLEQTRVQSDKLQAQQEELRVSNEELEQQAAALRSSEEELRQQQEELQATNEELEEKTQYLELQRAEMGVKNVELDNIRKGLEIKARELELTTRYKSEFLANMSHELRTPLNSLLLLSRNLMENGRGNLQDDQVEYARIIFRSGHDLLNLINEILDLSKIEAGKMTIHPETFHLSDLAESLTANFKPLADEKGLSLAVRIDENLPLTVHTDRQRLEQILRNLLSNAVKFCDKGSVSIAFQRPEAHDCKDIGLLPETAVAVAVRDTGMGIPSEKQLEIFEAFRQVEGGTARRFGGTGLGLTISRELARLLGGVVRLASVPGEGSTFTLILPQRIESAADGDNDTVQENTLGTSARQAEPAGAAKGASASAPGVTAGQEMAPFKTPPSLPDDRDTVPAGGAFILIVEDDPVFAKILLDQCRTKGFAALHAASGEEGLVLARAYPVGAIVLDIRLPGMSGWQVLETLKHDPELRHIPVHVMSAVEGSLDALRKGAVGFLTKPASREELDSALVQLEDIMSKKVKDLLVVEDDPAMRKGLSSLLSDANIHIHEATNGAEALAAIKGCRFDCMILDLGLPDMSGFELLEQLEQDTTRRIPPVIVYTGRELTREEERRLRNHSESIIIKGVKSEERLIDETALFLHQMVKSLPAKKRELIATLYDKDKALHGKTVLLVDDDMRNLYALAHVLGEKGLEVLKAEDGQKALEMLEERADVALVLLDIMMPVMDGYETLARIRSQPRLAGLPVIALTAKAMREDKAKCIAAGASDYLSKPVDLDRLLSVLRVWLYK